MQYKPESVEENYSSIQALQASYWNYINAFAWEFQNIQWKYSDANRYNQLLMQGFINPYINNPEQEMEQLAYNVFGYTLHVFETIAYALDCWRIHTDPKLRNRGITDKEYDQAIRLLKTKQYISGDLESILLKFRPQRNYYTHYGRIQFCPFIFEYRNELYQLMQVTTSLLSELYMKKDVVAKYNSQQNDYMKDMNHTFSQFLRSHKGNLTA